MFLSLKMRLWIVSLGMCSALNAVELWNLRFNQDDFSSFSQNFHYYQAINLESSFENAFKEKSLKIQLEERVSVELVQSELVDDGRFLHWVAKVANDPYGKAVLTYEKENPSKLAATIQTGGKTYRHFSRNNGHFIAIPKLNLDQQLLEEDFVSPSEDFEILGNKALISSPSSDNYIDVLFAYTDDVIAYDPNVEAVLANRVASINDSLKESCVNYRYRLVHQYEVNYAETGDLGGADFNCWYSWTDGCLDSVHALRETYGADLFTLVVLNHGTTLCGRAHGNGVVNGNWAYYDVKGDSVVGYNCGANTIAHEWGHNIGLMHDRYEHGYGATEERPDDQDAFGFVDLINKKRSIMSYPNQCSDQGVYCENISKFSNPNIKHNGIPFGMPKYANAARFLNERFGYVANFKTSKSSYAPSINNNCIAGAKSEEDVQCFIATAAFGSYMSDDVRFLRNFRDTVLLKTKLGEGIVALYYEFSPILANIIRNNESLKKISRIGIEASVIVLKYWYLVLSVMLLPIFSYLFIKVARSFLLGLLILLVTFSIGDHAQAKNAVPSLFPTLISDNPATRLLVPMGILAGLNYETANGEIDEAGYKKEVESTRTALMAGLYARTFFVDSQLYSKEKSEVSLTRSGGASAKDENQKDEFLLQAGFTVMNLGGFGVKYKTQKVEDNVMGQEYEEKTFGLGHISAWNSFRLGVYADLMEKTGGSIAQARWIKTGLGIAFSPFPSAQSGTGLTLEYNLDRSPEIKVVDNDKYAVQGEEWAHTVIAEYSGFFIPVLGLDKLRFDFSSSTQKKLEPYISSDIKTTKLTFLVGGKTFMNLDYFAGLRLTQIEEDLNYEERALLFSLAWRGSRMTAAQ